MRPQRRGLGRERTIDNLRTSGDYSINRGKSIKNTSLGSKTTH
jgi:hypothetical protein